MNELNSDVPRVATEKLVTTKELAKMLGVSRGSIKITVKELAKNNSQAFREIQRNSQGWYLFNEFQVAVIKIKLQNQTTAEVAQQLFVTPIVIIEDAKKCLPNKRIEIGKTTFWTQEEITILRDFIKSHRVGVGVSTDLTPALKIKKAMELMQEGYEEELAILKAKNIEQAQRLEQVRNG